MAKIHGSRGQVAMDVAGGTTYTTVADLNSWTLDTTRDTAEVTAFGNTNKQFVLGLPNYTGTLGGFWNTTSSPALFDAIFGTAAVGLKLTMDTAVATDFFSGLAYLTGGGIAVGVGGAVTITSGWVAAGNWTLAP